MQFANPIWLWALMGLSIPIGIHLLSRKEGKVIRVGSLRHLRETNTQQFKGIRLNEIVLLSLRCLMIILFVLLLSGLRLPWNPGTRAPWVLVEHGLENAPEVTSQLNNFLKEGYEARLLASGFPLLADSIIPEPVSYGSLVEELQSQRFSEAIVFSKNRITGFSGKRPSLPSNIRWVSVPSKPHDYTLQALTVNDSVRVRTGHTQGAGTYFTTQKRPAVEWKSALEGMDTLHIIVAADKIHQYDQQIIRAALQAIGQSFPVYLDVKNTLPEDVAPTSTADWHIILTETAPANMEASKIIYAEPQPANNIFVQETASRWVITKRLNEEIALHENLTIQLASLLLPSEKLWEKALQQDARVLSDEDAWGAAGNNRSMASIPAQSAELYLIALLMIILLIERTLAYHRNQ
jgi:hypothetical protein